LSVLLVDTKKKQQRINFPKTKGQFVVDCIKTTNEVMCRRLQKANNGKILPQKSEPNSEVVFFLF
jgi:hypothetical protein